MASTKAKKLLFGVAISAPVVYYTVSDSQSFIYKFITKVGHFITSNNPEKAHNIAIFLAKNGIVPRDRIGNDKILACKIWGISFPSCIGLAAGFDKNAECMTSMRGLGFGFVEIGSITPVPQPGNPKPRIFRLQNDLAVINRCGFNSDGMEEVANRLEEYRSKQVKEEVSLLNRGIIGVNLGKNKETEDALSDYVAGVQKLLPYADYLVINISSPNTVGLRNLQTKNNLYSLVSGVQKCIDSTLKRPGYLSRSTSELAKFRPPLLIKISPDMTTDELNDVCDVALYLKVDGIIVSNTTVNEREKLLTRAYADEIGGLSGKPLLSRSNQALSDVYKRTQGKIPLIGVGGVFNAQDALEKIKLGASLVQVYTGLIYEGPGLPADIKQGLVELLRQEGYSNVTEAIGAAHKKKMS